MKTLQKLLFAILVITAPFTGFAQFDEFDNSQPNDSTKKMPSFLKDRLFYGGDMGLQFGTVTMINLSPQVGIYLNKYTGVGVGATYTYYKDRFYNYQTQMYGGSLFAQFYPIRQITLHGEMLALNYEDLYTTGPYRRLWDYGLLLGGGYRMTFGKKSAVNYMILWNFNETETTPYSNPVFRISVYF